MSRMQFHRDTLYIKATQSTQVKIFTLEKGDTFTENISPINLDNELVEYVPFKVYDDHMYLFNYSLKLMKMWSLKASRIINGFFGFDYIN